MLRSNARENQDLVTVILFEGKREGTYLEIGGAGPITDNSTYLLEKEFGWKGLSVEMNPTLASQWSQNRKNICLQEDATTLDYDSLLNHHGLGPDIDFLQLDIDPAKNTLKALERINLKKFSFGFVTFEHDLYRETGQERARSREIFLDHGYTMLIGDVMHDNLVFEDWYVLERLMPSDTWQTFKGNKTKMNGTLPEIYRQALNRINH